MTQRIKRVLDELYNLKGEHNFVIAEIDEKVKKAEEAITNATEEQNKTEIKKSDVIGKLTVFNNQKDAFLSAFSDLDDDTFSSLRDIGIEANFGTMVSSVNSKAPEYCKSLKQEIEDYENQIETAKQTIKDNAALVAELQDNKRTEEEKRNKLVGLLEQSLSSEETEREALSTSYVKKILTAFDLFSEEDVTALAKLIIFPEDGLIEYNNSYDEEAVANFNVNAPVEEEPEETPVEESKEEPVVEETTEETSSESTEETSSSEPIVNIETEEKEEPREEKNISTFAPTVEPEEVEDTELAKEASDAEKMYQDVVEDEEVSDIIAGHDTAEIDLSSLNMGSDDEEKAAPASEFAVTDTEGLDEYLSSIGLDVSQVSDELKVLLANAEHKLIEENYEILRSAYVSEESIYRVVNNHNYLVDPDLNKKITLLRAKGISELKIKSMIEKEESKLRLGIDEFGESIDQVANADGKISNDNIYKIELDNKKYEINKKALNDAGYDIEEKEERNYNSVIYSSPYLPEDITVLKEYLLSIIKRNSKYALSVFWKNPTELTTDIDDIIEANLENILETNPEVLEENACELIKRVQYCNENGHQVYQNDDKDSYCDYITSYARFQEKIGNIEDLPTLESRKNNMISKIAGDNDFISSIVTALDNYYENPSIYAKFDTSIIDLAENIKQTVFTRLNYEDIGKYTYKINNAYVSKNKIDRNLKVIISSLENNKESYDDKAEEMVLTAILYNLRTSEDNMKEIADACLTQGGNN